MCSVIGTSGYCNYCLSKISLRVRHTLSRQFKEDESYVFNEISGIGDSGSHRMLEIQVLRAVIMYGLVGLLRRVAGRKPELHVVTILKTNILQNPASLKSSCRSQMQTQPQSCFTRSLTCN